MAANNKSTITKETRLSDLTVGDLQQLIHDATQSALIDFIWELQAYLPDPDEGKEFKPEITAKLREYIEKKDNERQYTLEEVKRELGLDE